MFSVLLYVVVVVTATSGHNLFPCVDEYTSHMVVCDFDVTKNNFNISDPQLFTNIFEVDIKFKEWMGDITIEYMKGKQTTSSTLTICKCKFDGSNLQCLLSKECPDLRQTIRSIETNRKSLACLSHLLNAIARGDRETTMKCRTSRSTFFGKDDKPNKHKMDKYDRQCLVGVIADHGFLLKNRYEREEGTNEWCEWELEHFLVFNGTSTSHCFVSEIELQFGAGSKNSTTPFCEVGLRATRCRCQKSRCTKDLFTLMNHLEKEKLHPTSLENPTEERDKYYLSSTDARRPGIISCLLRQITSITTKPTIIHPGKPIPIVREYNSWRQHETYYDRLEHDNKVVRIKNDVLDPPEGKREPREEPNTGITNCLFTSLTVIMIYLIVYVNQ